MLKPKVKHTVEDTRALSVKDELAFLKHRPGARHTQGTSFFNPITEGIVEKIRETEKVDEGRRMTKHCLYKKGVKRVVRQRLDTHEKLSEMKTMSVSQSGSPVSRLASPFSSQPRILPRKSVIIDLKKSSSFADKPRDSDNRRKSTVLHKYLTESKQKNATYQPYPSVEESTYRLTQCKSQNRNVLIDSEMHLQSPSVNSTLKKKQRKVIVVALKNSNSYVKSCIENSHFKTERTDRTNEETAMDSVTQSSNVPTNPL